MSSQALFVKIVTKILFGQCTFSKSHLTTVLEIIIDLPIGFPINNIISHRLGSRSQTSALKGKRPDHNILQMKTRIHTCAHTQKYKACATHVMLARASTTSLACTQSLKPLSDAQGIQSSEGVRTRRLDCTALSEYFARYPERNMVLPSPTLRCCTPSVAQ